MDRPIIYSLEQIRSFDTAWGWKDTMNGIGGAALAFLGTTETVLTGLGVTQASPASLILNTAAGSIYERAATDSTPYGPLAADPTIITQQGFVAAGTVTVNTGALLSGQSQWVLIEIAFAQVDAIRVGDPNDGVLPYVNINYPGQPLQGPNGSGVQQNTIRQGVAVITLKYGPPAATGSEVPPALDANNVPAYLIDLTYGQSTITNGQILIAGPAAYAGFQQAPFFPGIIGGVAATPGGSHHGGIAGQASKVLLTNAAEVQGILGFANLPVTNASPPTVSGIVTFAGEVPIESQGAGSPSGLLAGMRGDFYFDTVQRVLWVCIASGTAATAVWYQVGSGGIAQYYNTSPIVVVPANITYLADTTGGNIVFELPPAATMGGTSAAFKNLGANQLIITPQPGETIENLAAGASMYLYEQWAGVRLWPRASVGWYIMG